MTKKLSIIICVLFSLNAKANIELLRYDEINIVPACKYLNNQSMKQNANDVHIAKKIQEYLAMHEEQQKNGYVKDTDSRPKELMNLKHVAIYQTKKSNGIAASKDTHMRTSCDELKMAYTFMGVPKEAMTLNIGVAPYGAYKSIKNGDDGDGWDGAVQFFEKDGIGTCAFTEHNRRLAKSGVELIKELVTYDVRNKPTVLLIKGSTETGFDYKVKWYDNTFSRELECTNMDYSQDLTNAVIELANKIDSFN